MKILLSILLVSASLGFAIDQSDYYTTHTYQLPSNLVLEASGLAVLPDGKLAIGIRRGEVWIIDDPTNDQPAFHKFASGLHEVLGLAYHDGAVYATQRSEVTKLIDTNNDGVADEYLTAATGWGVSGNYHEYAYGPVFDKAGNMHNTLNASLGKGWAGAGDEAKSPLWRGWSIITDKQGKTRGFSAGFRSPCGIGLNSEGDVFVTDQQGNWMGTNPLFHVRDGAFFGHADALKDIKHEGSKVIDPGKLPDGQITTAEAITKVPGYCPPAVWFPYVKMGQSPTGLHSDDTNGKFGPFANQLFVGEFVMSSVNRVFLEKVGGEYQGACFPCISGLQCAALSVNFLRDGSLVVGQSNRGWNSQGNRPHGLQRVVWTGKTPLEVLKMELIDNGFHFTFTLPVDAKSLGDIKASSYTYTYQQKYGSPEMDTKELTTSSKLSADGLTLDVKCAPLRAGYVHEFELPELKARDGTPLWHRMAYYTLSRLK